MPTATQATPSIEVDSSGLITASTTQDAGYVTAGTKSTTEQLPAQGAQTIIPGTADKTIEAGKYLTGVQTIKGDTNLIPENIAKDVVVFGITGTHQSGEDVTAELTEQDELIEQISLVLEGKAAAGVEKPFAIIGVTYPEGSTCTCSKDEIVLTLDDTNGQDFFFLSEAGTWTVTATDGTNTKSQIVEITTKGQFTEITLVYATYILQAGVFNPLVGGFSRVESGVSFSDGIIVSNSNSSNGVAFYLTNPFEINTTQENTYDTLIVHIKMTEFTRGYPIKVGLHTSKMTSGDYNSKQKNLFTASHTMSKGTDYQTITIPISELSGSFYFNCCGIAIFEIDEIRLE